MSQPENYMHLPENLITLPELGHNWSEYYDERKIFGVGFFMMAYLQGADETNSSGLTFPNPLILPTKDEPTALARMLGFPLMFAASSLTDQLETYLDGSRKDDLNYQITKGSIKILEVLALSYRRQIKWGMRVAHRENNLGHDSTRLICTKGDGTLYLDFDLETESFEASWHERNFNFIPKEEQKGNNLAASFRSSLNPDELILGMKVEDVYWERNADGIIKKVHSNDVAAQYLAPHIPSIVVARGDNKQLRALQRAMVRALDSRLNENY